MKFARHRPAFGSLAFLFLLNGLTLQAQVKTAYLQVHVSPSSAILAGGAWRLFGTSTWNNDPNHTEVLFSSPATVEYRPIPGWTSPTNTTIPVVPATLTVAEAVYVPLPTLVVSPPNGLASSGFAGGPFAPGAATYTISNPGNAALNWSAGTTATWLDVSPSSGVLSAGETNSVAITVNSSANNLALGAYSNTVAFVNLANGLGNTTRSASLAVFAHPPVQLTNLRLLNDGRLALTLLGVTNRVYSIIGSTNLTASLATWNETLKVTNGSAGQVTFTNPSPATNRQFYFRAREL